MYIPVGKCVCMYYTYIYIYIYIYTYIVDKYDSLGGKRNLIKNWRARINLNIFYVFIQRFGHVSIFRICNINIKYMHKAGKIQAGHNGEKLRMLKNKQNKMDTYLQCKI